MSIIKKIQIGIREGKFSEREVYNHYRKNAEHYDNFINALSGPNHSRIADFYSSSKESVQSQLKGIPVIYKDNICTSELYTTCASRMLQKYRSPFDATVVARLKAAGAVTLAKANMDEFAMGSTSTTGIYGPVKNPWNINFGTGGSSGGSAAAVAARLSPLALGSDTGGSVRLPAHFCGVVGMKPTYGTLSRYGLVAFASSLDQIGVIGHYASDIGYALDIMGGLDSNDETTVKIPKNFFSRKIQESDKNITIGVDYSSIDKLEHRMQSVVRHTIAIIQHAGYTIANIKLPNLEQASYVYYILACAEATSNLSRFDGIRYGGQELDLDRYSLEEFYLTQRTWGFGNEVKKRIMAGNYFLLQENYESLYVNAQRYRRYLYNEFKSIYLKEKVDCILMNVCSFDAGEITSQIHDIYKSDIYTVAANLIGAPAIAFPVTLSSSRLPMGMQLLGPAFKDDLLISIVDNIQSYNDFYYQQPQFGGKDI